jgi:hypothetical protein
VRVLQVLGFAVLIYGTFVFNGVVGLPFRGCCWGLGERVGSIDGEEEEEEVIVDGGRGRSENV